MIGKPILKYGSSVEKSLLFVLLVLLACDQGIEPPAPPQPPLPPPPPTLASLKNLIFAQTDYDWIEIQNAETLLVPTQDIERISAGEKIDLAFFEVASVSPQYAVFGQGYLIMFDLRVNFHYRRTSLPLTVRYHFKDSTILDIDTVLSTLRYPYPSAELFLTNEIMPYDFFFQDIDRVGNKFYYHPLGGLGLFEYDLTTNQARELVNYGSGDHIAADYPFLFFDLGHNSVYRYNLQTDSLESFIVRFQSLSDTSIFGLDTYNGHLYVLTNLEPNGLWKYSFGGELIETINYAAQNYYMAIHNGILYSNGYARGISRFDLNTGTFLANIPSPADIDGIKFAEGYLYYCDYGRGLVGRIPIEDILTPPALVQK